MTQFKMRWPKGIILGIVPLFSFVVPVSEVVPAGPEDPPPPVPYYGENTLHVAREAHRKAIAALRLNNWIEACDALSILPDYERRPLTDYIELLCSTNQPEVALHADRHAHAALSRSAPPSLRRNEVDVLNRYRAWIAAIQDVLADEAERSGFRRPLPPWFRESVDLLSHAAWNDRGRVYDAPTYEATRRVFINKLETLEGKLAMSDIFSDVSFWTVDSVLYSDISDLPLPPLPAMSLPADSDL